MGYLHQYILRFTDIKTFLRRNFQITDVHITFHYKKDGNWQLQDTVAEYADANIASIDSEFERHIEKWPNMFELKKKQFPSSLFDGIIINIKHYGHFLEKTTYENILPNEKIKKRYLQDISSNGLQPQSRNYSRGKQIIKNI